MQIGKDRTGLIAALILAACGATDDEIVSDYARSDSPDGIALGGLEKMKELEGSATSCSQRLASCSSACVCTVKDVDMPTLAILLCSGLDHKQFESAPPSAMATVLEYLRCAPMHIHHLADMPTMVHVGRPAVVCHRTNYGGAAEYLQHIGFDEKEQERLKLSLSKQ